MSSTLDPFPLSGFIDMPQPVSYLLDMFEHNKKTCVQLHNDSFMTLNPNTIGLVNNFIQRYTHRDPFWIRTSSDIMQRFNVLLDLSVWVEWLNQPLLRLPLTLFVAKLLATKNTRCSSTNLSQLKVNKRLFTAFVCGFFLETQHLNLSEVQVGLLEIFMDINEPDFIQKLTLLAIAVKFKRYDDAELLVDLGARIDVPNVSYNVQTALFFNDKTYSSRWFRLLDVDEDLEVHYNNWDHLMNMIFITNLQAIDKAIKDVGIYLNRFRCLANKPLLAFVTTPKILRLLLSYRYQVSMDDLRSSLYLLPKPVIYYMVHSNCYRVTDMLEALSCYQDYIVPQFFNTTHYAMYKEKSKWILDARRQFERQMVRLMSVYIPTLPTDLYKLIATYV